MHLNCRLFQPQYRTWERLPPFAKFRTTRLFSSHFSRTAITDLHHNRCDDSSTVHHREVRPSPETNASAVSNIFHGSLTTNETVLIAAVSTHPKSMQTAESPAKSYLLNTLPLSTLLSST